MSEAESADSERDQEIRDVIVNTFGALAIVLLGANLIGIILILEEIAPGQLTGLQAFVETGLFGVLAILVVSAFEVYKTDIIDAIERARGSAE